MQAPLRILCLAAILVALGARASAENPPSQRADVLVTAISCKQDAGELPTLQYWAWDRGSNAPGTWSTAAAVGAETGDGVYTLSVSLLAGKYALRASTSHCGSGSQTETLLPGTTRHFVLPLSVVRIERISPSCAIAGTLPARGFRVELLSKTGKSLPISVDGDLYDAEYLPSGMYTLRLTLANGVVADYAFDLSKEPRGEFCENTFIHNISMDDLRRDAYFLSDDGSKQPIWPASAVGRMRS
jgi:hypothetical protein